MTDIAAQNQRRYRVGITSVLRRCSAGAGLAVCLAVSGASASPFTAVWAAFETRCLAAFENFAPVDVDGLVAVSGQDGAYHLSHGAILILSGEDSLGTRSCAVKGAGLVKGFDAWRAASEDAGRYLPADQPGVWMSHEWIEPRIAVQKSDGAVRVVETELES